MSKQITSEELTALRVYADNAGSNWKRNLARDWLRAGHRDAGALPFSGRIDEHGWAILEPMRHTHGTGWLTGFEIPSRAFEFVEVPNAHPHDETIFRAEGLRLAVSRCVGHAGESYYTIDAKTGDLVGKRYDWFAEAADAAIAAGADEFVAERKDHDTTEYHAPGLRLAAVCREHEDHASYYTIDAASGEYDAGPFADLDSAKQAAIAAGNSSEGN